MWKVANKVKAGVTLCVVVNLYKPGARAETVNLMLCCWTPVWLLLQSHGNCLRFGSTSYVWPKSDRDGTYGWTFIVTLLSADWEIVAWRAAGPARAAEAAANDAIFAWISADGVRPNVDITTPVLLDDVVGGGIRFRSIVISLETTTGRPPLTWTADDDDKGWLLLLLFFVSSSCNARSHDGSRCLKRARDNVWFNSVCSWFLMAPSDDLSPAGDVLCLLGKKSNLVGSGRTSW